jgi:hypothetical protein
MMRLLSNFNCFFNLALTSGSSASSFRLLLIALAILETIWYSGIVGLFSKRQRSWLKPASVLMVGKASDIAGWDEKNWLNRLYKCLGG